MRFEFLVDRRTHLCLHVKALNPPGLLNECSFLVARHAIPDQKGGLIQRVSEYTHSHVDSMAVFASRNRVHDFNFIAKRAPFKFHHVGIGGSGDARPGHWFRRRRSARFVKTTVGAPVDFAVAFGWPLFINPVILGRGRRARLSWAMPTLA